MIFSDEPETVEQMLYIHQLIQQKIGASATKSSLQPLWYRGLSDSQMAAADSLHVALGDDILEGSTYRVYYVLHRLGVNPRPPKSGLLKLFPMSRGNDVAFLWFLMESYYKSKNHEKLYGSNEQIIMSTIFWLDLYPTLRELDRVLPLGHASAETRKKEALAEACRSKQAEKEKHMRLKKRQQSKSKTQFSVPISPYFEKPLKRKFIRRNLLATPPKRPASLPIMPAESPNCTLWSRWFGGFDFSDGQRIATTVLKKEIDDIVSSLHAAKLQKRHVESMCMHHKKINEMELSLRLNLEKIKRQRRELLMNVDYRTKERNRRRTLDQLDRLTEHYQQQFHAMAAQTRMSSIRKKLCVDSQDLGFAYLGNINCCPKHDCGDDNDDIVDRVLLLEGSELLPPTCLDNMPEESIQNCNCKVEKLSQPLGQRPSTMMRFLQLQSTEADNEVRSSCSRPCSCRSDSTKYFDINGSNYSFNYRKLFAPSKSTLLDSDQLRLRVQFVKALDADVEYLRAVLDGDKSGSVDSLVDRSTKRIFQQGTVLFDQEYDKLLAEEATKEPQHRLDFGQKYYDADNIDLMKEMLRIGLDRVAVDRRYILPTLPNVHSVPSLIKWIRRRYGKLYSSAELKREFTEANILMKHLMLILRKEIVRRQCRRPIVLPSKVMNIRDQNKMSRVLNFYWSQFMKYFVLSMMELGRIFHSTMQADQGSLSTSTYYAYMPAHIQDIEFSRTTPFFDRRKRSKVELH